MRSALLLFAGIGTTGILVGTMGCVDAERAPASTSQGRPLGGVPVQICACATSTKNAGKFDTVVALEEKANEPQTVELLDGAGKVIQTLQFSVGDEIKLVRGKDARTARTRTTIEGQSREQECRNH